MTHQPNSSINVPLSPDLRAFVEDEVARGRHRSAAEVILAAIRRAKERREALADLEAKLLVGLDEEPVEVTPETWQRRRDELKRRHGTRDAS